MQTNPIDKYCTKLHENIFEKILGMLYITKMKPALKVAEKLLDDPEFQSHLETLRYHNDNLENFLKNFCKKRPDDPECKRRNKRLGR